MMEALRRYWSKHGLVVGPLTIFAAIANFLQLTRFGFYEDDWYYMASAWGADPTQWFNAMLNSVRHFYVGRPVQEICLYVFAYFGASLHSITALYVIAAVLYCASVVLAYHTIALRYPRAFAAAAATLFAISPLTTIRQHLDGTLWSAPGFLFLFTAILLYAGRRRRDASYVPAALALLIYEPFFFVFLAAPVLRRGRKTWRDVGIHLGVCGAILAVYLVVRRATGEARLSSTMTSPSALTTAWKAAAVAIWWSARSFLSYLYGAHAALREASTGPILWTVALMLLLLFTVFRSWIRRPIPRNGSRSLVRAAWWIRRAALPALFLILLGYTVSYFTGTQASAFPLVGRDTRFSLAATLGSSIFVVAIVFSLLALNGRRIWKLTILRGSFFALAWLCLYSFVIQDDYVREWAHDRAALSQIVSLSPDVTPDSLIVVRRMWAGEPPFLRTHRMPSINSAKHGFEISLRHMFANRRGPWIVLVDNDQWKSLLATRPDGTLHWTQAGIDGSTSRDPNEPVGPILTFVEDASGCVTRVNQPIEVGGRQVVLLREANLPTSSNWTRLQPSPLVPLVLDNAGDCRSVGQ